jgi:two-component system LytT family sensor kinase
VPCRFIAADGDLLWNLGSLIGMAAAPQGDPLADAIVAGSFSVLSLLPAVLQHISLRSRHSALWMTGYAVSFAAVLMLVTIGLAYS